MTVWGKSVPGRGHSRCKDPEARARLALMNREEISEAGTEGWEKKSWR